MNECSIHTNQRDNLPACVQGRWGRGNQVEKLADCGLRCRSGPYPSVALVAQHLPFVDAAIRIRQLALIRWETVRG